MFRVNIVNSMISIEYKNELSKVLAVDIVAVLYVTFLKLVPIAVFLFMVYKYCILFVAVRMHGPVVTPLANAA